MSINNLLKNPIISQLETGKKLTAALYSEATKPWNISDEIGNINKKQKKQAHALKKLSTHL